MYFSATQISNRLNMGRLEVNPRIEALGYQLRDEKGVWLPTEEGKQHCRLNHKVHPTKGPYVMLTWDDHVLAQLGLEQPPTKAQFDELKAEHQLLEAKVEELTRIVSTISERVL